MLDQKEHDWIVGEIELFITNDHQIYKDLLVPAYTACERSYDKDKFNFALALRIFKSIVVYGVNKYKRELDPSINVTIKARTEIALNLLSSWESEFKLGNRQGV